VTRGTLKALVIGVDETCDDMVMGKSKDAEVFVVLYGLQRSKCVVSAI